MPIYEYACPKCGQFELMRRISDPPLKKCPTCKRAVKKLMSNSSFQLKGTGWYVTDYARKSSGGDTGTKSESSGSGDAGGSSESTAKAEASTATAKSDSKPDTKPEKKAKASDGGKTSAAA